MLIPLDSLLKKYNIKIKGILHVGAHECEELPEYEKLVPRNKILWIEAMPHKVKECKARIPDLLIENAVVSDKVENIKFYVSNNGQSSSMLELGLHKKFHPSIVYVGYYECETQLLQNIICKYDIEYNFLNFDIQGAELRALKGMEPYLDKVDYLVTEVNSDYVYKDCALIGEIDEYLKQYGLVRVETSWFGENHWGDAFYIKKTLIPKVPSKTTDNGRLCNQIIRNLCTHFIAQKFDLCIDYVNYDTMKAMGIELFKGNNCYSSTTRVDDDNYFDILNADKLETNIDLNQNYFQTRAITNYIYQYMNSIKDRIIAKNPFSLRYNNNNDCIIHIRLTDAEQYSLSYDVFAQMIKQVQFDNLFVTSDNPYHPYVQQIMASFNAKLIQFGTVETLQFASTCKNVILSGGTYSAMIGYLAFYSNVYYSKHTRDYTWHGDVFSIPGWNEL